MFDAWRVAAAVLMSAGFLNDDGIQKDTDCAETTERLVTNHWLFVLCGRVYHVEPAKSYNWDFVIEKQSNNNRIWLWNKHPKTLFIAVRGSKLKPFFPPSSMLTNRCCKLWPVLIPVVHNRTGSYFSPRVDKISPRKYHCYIITLLKLIHNSGFFCLNVDIQNLLFLLFFSPQRSFFPPVRLKLICIQMYQPFAVC